MDNRLKLKEVIQFFKDLKEDLKSDNVPSKYKYACFKKIIKDLFKIIFNAITGPIIYTIWYIFRKKITERVYQDTGWKEILSLMDSNQPLMVKDSLQRNGKFWYWIWTYGDAEDPLIVVTKFNLWKLKLSMWIFI